MTNSAKKGNRYENVIASMLSWRFADYLGRYQSFGRNTDSGSNHYGDINCPDKFKFVIECKFYKKAPSLDLIFKQDVKQWDEWIEQVLVDAEKADKHPLLVIKYNRTIDVVMTHRSFLYGTPIITYKGWAIYPLDKFMELSNSIFFGE